MHVHIIEIQISIYTSLGGSMHNPCLWCDHVFECNPTICQYVCQLARRTSLIKPPAWWQQTAGAYEFIFLAVHLNRALACLLWLDKEWTGMWRCDVYILPMTRKFRVIGGSGLHCPNVKPKHPKTLGLPSCAGDIIFGARVCRGAAGLRSSWHTHSANQLSVTTPRPVFLTSNDEFKTNVNLPPPMRLCVHPCLCVGWLVCVSRIVQNPRNTCRQTLGGSMGHGPREKKWVDPGVTFFFLRITFLILWDRVFFLVLTFFPISQIIIPWC